MNKTILVLVIVVVVIVILVVGYLAIYGGNQGPMYGTTTPSNTNVPPPVTTPAPQPTNLAASVSIKNFAFNPTPLNIKVGTTVTWTNNDSAPHQIKSSDFNSNILSNGQSFSFTFSTAGTYNYSCAIHTYMHGQIIVSQ